MCAYIKPCVSFYRVMSEVNLFVSLKNLIAISWPAAVLFRGSEPWRSQRPDGRSSILSCVGNHDPIRPDPTRNADVSPLNPDPPAHYSKNYPLPI